MIFRPTDRYHFPADLTAELFFYFGVGIILRKQGSELEQIILTEKTNGYYQIIMILDCWNIGQRSATFREAVDIVDQWLVNFQHQHNTALITVICQEGLHLGVSGPDKRWGNFNSETLGMSAAGSFAELTKGNCAMVFICYYRHPY